MSDFLFYAAIAVTLLFAFINGFHDGCNVIATVIGSRSMSPKRALIYGSLAEFVGPFVLGTAVAGTIAHKILLPELLFALPAASLNLLVLSAVIGAIIWNLVTWVVGLPSSSSHALIGGLIGAGVVTLGTKALAVEAILYRVVLPLFISPILGLLAGYLLFALLRRLFAPTNNSVKHLFIFLQGPGTFFLGMGHGSNDAQKSMGIIALVLAVNSGTGDQELLVPFWVVSSCALAIALGLSTGGWTIIKTVGYSIFRMQPIHSFASQFASSTVVALASVLGGPVSTTQVVASSVLGVGAARRLSGVRWSVARNILYAWVLTIPVSAAIGAALCFGLRLVCGD